VSTPAVTSPNFLRGPFSGGHAGLGGALGSLSQSPLTATQVQARQQMANVGNAQFQSGNSFWNQQANTPVDNSFWDQATTAAGTQPDFALVSEQTRNAMEALMNLPNPWGQAPEKHFPAVKAFKKIKQLLPKHMLIFAERLSKAARKKLINEKVRAIQ